MARTAIFSDDGDEDESTNYDTTTASRHTSRRATDASPSPSAISFGSDKENRDSGAARNKGKGRAMGPPDTPASEVDPSRRNLKRKLGSRDQPTNAAPTIHEQNLEKVTDTDLYDPDQSIEERRRLRREYRDLSSTLTEYRAEYLNSASDGLLKTVEKSNELYNSVKQTSDATLDSRLLVTTADLSAKRTTQLNLGENTTGVDVDDFVSKCIIFMRKGPSEGDAATQTQTQRNRRRIGDDSDEEPSLDFDEGDAFNWEYLGRHACLPFNLRPSTPGFLLGPLSVQKRVRRATQRRERLQKRDPRDATRPEELQAKDLEQSENSNLRSICENVHKTLRKHLNDAAKRVEALVTEDMDDDEIEQLMWQHNIAENSGAPFFHFAFNPRSFGQTVENIFYISFLIKEGNVAFSHDRNGLPTLLPTEPRTTEEQRSNNIQKQQAIFHIDYDIWDDIVTTFGIEKCVIPHRRPDPTVEVGEGGWYT